MKSATPFFNNTLQLSKLRTRFFVPGHKGNAEALPPFSSILPFDLTEIEGADNLAYPRGSLLESQINMAKAFGSAATLYSTFGTSSCIEAMLHLYLSPGMPVLMARSCHVSALRALIFTGAFPVWLPLENGRVTPSCLQSALQQHPKASVYLTSFDYFGRCPNISALANICKQAGSALLVDNAHGAHLAFLKPSLHPLHLGATTVADSAHKTLPCLTGAALLHLSNAAQADLARELLNLYSSTSPHYLVLESLDLCAGQLLDAALDFQIAAQHLEQLSGQFPHLCEHNDDPLKLCLNPAKGGWPLADFLHVLFQNQIFPEFYDDERVVFMASACNCKEDFTALANILNQFPARPALQSKPLLPFTLPQIICSPREAYFGKKERVLLGDAIGRVVAGLNTPCPPGVPLLVPGEQITAEHIPHLAKGSIFELDVLQ